MTSKRIEDILTMLTLLMNSNPLSSALVYFPTKKTPG
jgi:hypothetical protein